MSSKKPDWFVLIDRWVPEQMGEHGPTLSFLVGALALKADRKNLDSTHVRELITEMTSHPVPGFVTEVMWCGGIRAPVFKVKAIDSPDRITPKTGITHPSGDGYSLVFSYDLFYIAPFIGSDSKPSKVVRLLTEDASAHVSLGRYSRIKNLCTNNYEYGDFLEREKVYIKKVIVAVE